ncbi:MAG TPA: UDP-3-O-acyl-N-acetylglucosamine deacetylase [Stellaceae bacterium]|nr:UDP-3-O-acyl-N-acetylglucosamine deacetylase [Stellaceae bacterium]
MGSARQKTLKTPIRCRGVGLHSGVEVAMTLVPAPADTGIRFRRTDLGVELAATWRNLAESALCTTLATDRAAVATVEHLMAACAGLEVDNAVVELNGPEVPVMDGSAAPFVFLIERAGLVEQDAPRRAIEVLKPVRVAADGKSASLEPASAFALSFEMDFAGCALMRQKLTVVVDPAGFKRDICRARTFGFLEEVETMRAAGLARGGSLDNAVVISGERVLNAEGLRYGDEFVRHKLLDAIGDLYLAGGPILGRFQGCRSGHALNRLLLQRLFADPSAWRHATIAGPDEDWEEPRRATA